MRKNAENSFKPLEKWWKIPEKHGNTGKTLEIPGKFSIKLRKIFENPGNSQISRENLLEPGISVKTSRKTGKIPENRIQFSEILEYVSGQNPENSRQKSESSWKISKIPGKTWKFLLSTEKSGKTLKQLSENLKKNKKNSENFGYYQNNSENFGCYQKNFEIPRNFSKKLKKILENSGKILEKLRKFLETPENFWNIPEILGKAQKASRFSLENSGKFFENPGKARKLRKSLEKPEFIWKIPEKSGNFLKILKNLPVSYSSTFQFGFVRFSSVEFNLVQFCSF